MIAKRHESALASRRVAPQQDTTIADALSSSPRPQEAASRVYPSTDVSVPRDDPMSAATYQTPDSKKEEFRKYLEKSGVVDALTKVLVGLYEEADKPPNAVDYVKRFMGAPTGIDVDALRAENEELKKKNAELIKTIEELNKRLTTEEEEDEA